MNAFTLGNPIYSMTLQNLNKIWDGSNKQPDTSMPVSSMSSEHLPTIALPGLGYSSPLLSGVLESAGWAWVLNQRLPGQYYISIFQWPSTRGTTIENSTMQTESCCSFL